MPSSDKYTDPELRDEIKDEIHQSDKAGRPGQWSARKAQMMAAEYKKRGGGYTTDKESGQDESQKHLNNWTEEKWHTKEGSGTAKKDYGSRKRYLPKKVWEEMSEKEKEETETKKEEGEKEGKQYVGNTETAKNKRKDASKSEVQEGTDDDDGDGKSKGQQKTTNEKNNKEKEGPGEDKDEGEEEVRLEDSNEEEKDEDMDEEAENGKEDDEQEEENGDEPRGQTRVTTHQDDGSNKKQKANDGTANETDE